jgi:hypothetical protein
MQPKKTKNAESKYINGDTFFLPTSKFLKADSNANAVITDCNHSSKKHQRKNSGQFAPMAKA